MPYMSASIQFIVSAPSSPSPSNSSITLPLHPIAVSSIPSSSPRTSPSIFSSAFSNSSSFPPSPPAAAPELQPSFGSTSSWLRTYSWASQYALATYSQPPISPPPCDLEYGRISDSDNIVNCLHTSVRFLQDCRLSLIYIPLDLYPHFVQAILSVILTESSRKDDWGRRSPSNNGYEDSFAHGRSSEASIATDFVNVSVTPIECSVVCSKKVAEKYFIPIINSLDENKRTNVSISEDDFVAIQVDGEGLDAGQRVLDLTGPLALADVPIFFITTYFSDYILVPENSRKNVTKALQHRGFKFEIYSESFVTPHSHHRSSSAQSYASATSSTLLKDLENRTFETLRKHAIVPQVNQDAGLVLCAGRRKGPGGEDGVLKLGLVKCLVSQPRFISVTLTDTEPASLLLQKDMLPMFDTDPDILLGSKDDLLIPIILDFRELPVDSTGIVCGVAGRLVGGTKGGFEDAVEMSYLSTARAGTVMVAQNDISRAMAALNM